MFKFTKSFIRNNDTKIATNYNQITDIQRIEQIRQRLHPTTNQEESKKIEESRINQNIHRDRINSIRNIKKD